MQRECVRFCETLVLILEHAFRQMQPQLLGWCTDNVLAETCSLMYNTCGFEMKWPVGQSTRKVGTACNPTDLITTCLPNHIIESHLASLHWNTSNERSDSSLQLHARRCHHWCGRRALRQFSEGECEDMITVLFVKAACVSLWRVPNLQASTARGFRIFMGVSKNSGQTLL